MSNNFPYITLRNLLIWNVVYCLQIQASLTTTEAELTEAKRQYDMMLEVKQLELSKHLKDLCQKNDQVIIKSLFKLILVFDLTIYYVYNLVGAL